MYGTASITPCVLQTATKLRTSRRSPRKTPLCKGIYLSVMLSISHSSCQGQPCRSMSVSPMVTRSTESNKLAMSPIFFCLPIELITIVAGLLGDHDLCQLTRTNQRMASIIYPAYLRRRGINVMRSFMSVRRAGFIDLPELCRFLLFTDKPWSIAFHFDYDAKRAKKQTDQMYKFMRNIPRSSAIDTLNVWYNTPMSVRHVLSLLELADFSGFRAIGYHCLAEADTKSSCDRRKIVLRTINRIQLTHSNLLPSSWKRLLEDISAPLLGNLAIDGNLTLSTVIEFVLRHPLIEELHLSGTLQPTRLRSTSSPNLRYLYAPLPSALIFLDSLQSPSSILDLNLEPVENLQYSDFVEGIIKVISLCGDCTSLSAGFTPPIGSSQLVLLSQDIVSSRAQRSTAVSKKLASLYFGFQNVLDNDILVCSQHHNLCSADLFSLGLLPSMDAAIPCHRSGDSTEARRLFLP